MEPVSHRFGVEDLPGRLQDAAGLIGLHLLDFLYRKCRMHLQRHRILHIQQFQLHVGALLRHRCRMAHRP